MTLASSSMTEDTPYFDEGSGGTRANDRTSKSWKLRGVQWRVKLGVLPSSPAPVDELRRVAADCRRRYAELRRRLFVDPHLMEEGQRPSQLHIDNPLSQDPESIWGRFFRNAELERIIDKDLTRLYPENGVFFQSPACQAMLRRILLVWSLIHPQTSYRQGMHELLAPLVYVLHVDVSHLEQVKHQYEELFDDRFDSYFSGKFGNEKALNVAFPGSKDKDTIFSDSDSGAGKEDAACDLFGADADVRVVVLGSDSYGVEGELGALLSTRFLEHDAYCMFDALLSGRNGAVAMADYFLTSTGSNSPVGQPPVLEASAALYHLLAAVDINLYAHLVELGVEPQFFALRWLRLLFGREFLLDDLLLIWDAIFLASNTPLAAEEGCDDTRYSVKVSPRSALISAFAVSMLRYVGPALLAAPDATGCLQRLLNFPQIRDVRQLVENAKLLQPIAQSSTRNPSPSIFKLARSHEKKRIMKQRSGGSVSPPTFQGHVGHGALRHQQSTPCSPDLLRMSIPESYWEEKWTHSVLHNVTSGENISSTGKVSAGRTPEALSRSSSNLDNQQVSAAGNTEMAREEIPSKQVGNIAGDQTDNVVGQLDGTQQVYCGQNNGNTKHDDGGNLVRRQVIPGQSTAINSRELVVGEGTSVQSQNSSTSEVTLNIVTQSLETGNGEKSPADMLLHPSFPEPRSCENATDTSITRQLGEEPSECEEGHGFGMRRKSVYVGRTRKALFATEQESDLGQQSSGDAKVDQQPLGSEGIPEREGRQSCDNIKAATPLTGLETLQEAGVDVYHASSQVNPAVEEYQCHLQAEHGQFLDKVSQGSSSKSTTSRSQEAVAQNGQMETNTSLSKKANSAPVTTAPLKRLSWVWNLGKTTPADKSGSGASCGGISDLEIAASISAPDLWVSKPSRWWQSGLEVSSGAVTKSEISNDRVGSGTNQGSPPKIPVLSADVCEKPRSTSEINCDRSNGSLKGHAAAETDPVNTDMPRCTTSETLEGEGFKESMTHEPARPTNDGSTQREEGGDVFEKHIVSEVPRHTSVVVGSRGEAIGEKHAGSSPLEHDKRSKDKGASAALQVLGLSMLDHIQVLESVFSQRGPGLETDELSNPVLGGRGHVAAVVALAELRRISSALQQA